MSPETVLITGASSGLGLHLAREFARKGHSLVLVAPVQAELNTVGWELTSEFGVRVSAIAEDLKEPQAAEIVARLVRDLEIGILVNNAGHGQQGRAWEIPLRDDLSMIRLNIEGLVRMTKQFLPAMVERGEGRVLNTASVAGFEPGPGYAVFAATKAFVISYSEALAAELEGTGVSVTALCPGPTDTDFLEKAELVANRTSPQASLMAPEEMAEAGYVGVMQGERVVIPGALNKTLMCRRHFLPEATRVRG